MTRRQLLLPMVPVYAAALGLKEWLRRVGHMRPYVLEGPVLSVGSLSAGGAGKTPVVQALASVLRVRGYAVSILTRGYGRGSKQTERVDPAGTAERYGDEPLLLAQRTQVPVYVGADRYKAGLVAEEAAAPGMLVHLLDDGFQHRRLARDLDLVLLTRRDVEDVLLPAGDLREPLTALREADVVVLREEEAEALTEFVAVLTQERGTPPIWVVRRRLQFPVEAWPRPKRPMLFCGIARPEGFAAMVRAEGIEPAGTVWFRDHHGYREGDMDRLVGEGRRRGADGFCTTEKDAVKLTTGMRAKLQEVGPVAVPELVVSFVDERVALDQLIALVPRLNRRRGR